MPQSDKPSSASLAAIEAAALQLLHAVRSAGKAFPSQFPALLGAQAPAGRPRSVAELFNEFLLSKARVNRSDNYLRVAHNHSPDSP